MCPFSGDQFLESESSGEGVLRTQKILPIRRQAASRDLTIVSLCRSIGHLGKA